MLLWCFGFLGGIRGAAGNHYRYLWRNCYRCYLGRAGYGVAPPEMRPGTWGARGARGLPAARWGSGLAAAGGTAR